MRRKRHVGLRVCVQVGVELGACVAGVAGVGEQRGLTSRPGCLEASGPGERGMVVKREQAGVVRFQGQSLASPVNERMLSEVALHCCGYNVRAGAPTVCCCRLHLCHPGAGAWQDLRLQRNAKRNQAMGCPAFNRSRDRLAKLGQAVLVHAA